MKLDTLGADLIKGTEGDDLLNGTDGADLIRGLDGDDILYGRGGHDRIYGGAGNDILHGSGNTPDAIGDLLSGGAGDDILFGEAGDTLDGGGGSDYVYLDLQADTASIEVNLGKLAKGKALRLDDGALLKSIEHGSFSFGSGDDVIRLGKAVLAVDGGAGDDHIIDGGGNGGVAGGAGDDTLEGGGGNDFLHGGAGNDRLLGGAGLDTAVYADADAGVSIDLRLVAAQDTGGGGTDLLQGIENLQGSFFDDHLIGNDQANSIIDGYGDDTLEGGGGDDFLVGDDIVTPFDSTRDLIDGGLGQDTLRGGADKDTFVFHTLADSTNVRPDLIVDLKSEEADAIDLSGIDADTTQEGDQAFRLVHGHFSGHAGEVLLTFDPGAGHTLLQLDVDGDGAADSSVIILGDQRGFTGFVF